jgi:pyruvate dehydrogenase E1 component beta subunit
MIVVIAESGFIGAAVGAAALGLRPVAELMYSGFIGVCLDPLLNQASKLKYMSGGKAKIPLVVRVTYGAGFSEAAQHSQVLYLIFVPIPGLKVVAPSTPYNAKGLLISSIRDDDPVVFFEHVTMVDFKGPVPEEAYTLSLGVADIKNPAEMPLSLPSVICCIWLSKQLSCSQMKARMLKWLIRVPCSLWMKTAF